MRKRRAPKKPQASAEAITEVDARWQLQTAKARFSELFRRARSEGPQWVTRQGKEAVVILPAEEFERLSGRARRPRSLVKFFTEFKAKCLSLLEQVRKTKKPIRVTRFGKPVAEVVPPSPVQDLRPGWVLLSGAVEIVGDIVSPVIEEGDWEALRH